MVNDDYFTKVNFAARPAGFIPNQNMNGCPFQQERSGNTVRQQCFVSAAIQKI